MSKKPRPALAIILALILAIAACAGILFLDGAFTKSEVTVYPIGNMGSAQQQQPTQTVVPAQTDAPTNIPEPAPVVEPEPVLEPDLAPQGGSTGGNSGSSGSSTTGGSTGGNSGGNSGSGGGGSSTTPAHTHSWATRQVKTGEKWVVDVPERQVQKANGSDYVCSCGINWGDDRVALSDHQFEAGCTYSVKTHYDTVTEPEIGHYEDIMGTETYCTGCGAVK